jgi:sugar phosphate isomerase/epimerase
MRVAIQTISWGRHLKDVGALLRQIHEIGYEGVEFAQHPGELGPPDVLYESLTRLGLTLVGLAGGALAEKIDHVRRFLFAQKLALLQGSRSAAAVARLPSAYEPYIYVDEWEGQRSQDALADGYTLALHPHMFKSVQTAQEAEEFLRGHPRLRFLPDTAHLKAAGEDVVAVLTRNYARIEALHLKDWAAEFGRAYPFYSRGFVELGKGDVPLDDVIDFLKAKAYRGWLVVEQDASEAPLESARQSRRWLQERGI